MVYNAKAAGAFTFAQASAKVNKTPFWSEKYFSDGAAFAGSAEINNNHSVKNICLPCSVQNK